MCSSPLVSIIIPTYNYGHLIHETLRSVLTQTLADWECVIVDDGSTDDTAAIVANYVEKDERISYIYQRNSRLSAARNTGLRNSTGKYIQFLDADDLIEPKKLELQVAYLEEHPVVDIVYGGYRYFQGGDTNDKSNIVFEGGKSSGSPVYGGGRDVLDILFRTNFTVVSAPLVRRSLTSRVELFDETLHALEDWDFWIRCAIVGGRFHYEDLDGTLALIRTHLSSMSVNRRGIIAAALLMQRKRYFAHAGRGTEMTSSKIYAQFSEWIGIEEVLAGNRIRGIYQLLKAAAAGGTLKRRAKRLVYAGIALFVSSRQFRKIATSSVAQPHGDGSKVRKLKVGK